MYLSVKREETAGEATGCLWSSNKGVKDRCFDFERDTHEGLFNNPRGACGFARLSIGDESNSLNSPLAVTGSCPYDVLASAERPTDVLTDVVLRLTFDNTAYLEQICDDAEASALLPDSLSRNSPSALLHLRNSTNSFHQPSFSLSPADLCKTSNIF